MTCDRIDQMALALVGEASDSTLFASQAGGLLGIAIGEFTPLAERYLEATEGVTEFLPMIPTSLADEFPLPECFAVATAYRLAEGYLLVGSPEMAVYYRTCREAVTEGIESKIKGIITPIADQYA